MFRGRFRPTRFSSYFIYLGKITDFHYAADRKVMHNNDHSSLFSLPSSFVWYADHQMRICHVFLICNAHAYLLKVKLFVRPDYAVGHGLLSGDALSVTKIDYYCANGPNLFRAK